MRLAFNEQLAMEHARDNSHLPPAAPTWTAERVRKELPAVNVLIDGHIYEMGVYGRLCEFAGVRPFEYGSAVCYTFAWETIAHSLNTGKPLRV